MQRAASKRGSLESGIDVTASARGLDSMRGASSRGLGLGQSGYGGLGQQSLGSSGERLGQPPPMGAKASTFTIESSGRDKRSDRAPLRGQGSDDSSMVSTHI